MNSPPTRFFVSPQASSEFEFKMALARQNTPALQASNPLRALFMKNRDFFCYGVFSSLYAGTSRVPPRVLAVWAKTGPQPCGGNKQRFSSQKKFQAYTLLRFQLQMNYKWLYITDPKSFRGFRETGPRTHKRALLFVVVPRRKRFRKFKNGVSGKQQKSVVL